MSVRLSAEDSPFRREEDAGKLLVIVDVVCSSCGAIDFDIVVVPPQQSLPVEVESLFCAMRRDICGETNLQTTPRFACLLPRLHFF